MSRRCKIIPLIMNLIDGTFYRPSYPDGWTEGDALAAMFSRTVQRFYFREVRRVHRWILPDYWEDTGTIWQPESGSFKVLSSPEEIREALKP